MNDLTAFLNARLDEGALPSRVIEALRAILARYGSLPSVTNLGEHLQRSQEQVGLDYAIRTLASIWSDHPDYRQEWKP